MSNFTLSDGFLLKVFSNKNSRLFEEAGNHVLKENSGSKDQVGIIYNDFNADPKMVDNWQKETKGMSVYYVAPRSKTLRMDAKVLFAKKMKESQYVPMTYFNYDEIPTDTPDNTLFFVKKNGSTGSRGVDIHPYSGMKELDYTERVVQQNMDVPDLYDDKRYKIRAYVVLHDKNVFLFNKSFATVAGEDYKETVGDMEQDVLRKMHVIFQTSGTKFILSEELDKFELVQQNMLVACKDFKNVYRDEIKRIEANEYVILGLDFVVDSEGGVQIIEINHRSNYAHPKLMENKVDVPLLKNLFKLLIQGSSMDTDFRKV
jgi:hypothetical protein